MFFFSRTTGKPLPGQIKKPTLDVFQPTHLQELEKEEETDPDFSLMSDDQTPPTNWQGNRYVTIDFESNDVHNWGICRF